MKVTEENVLELMAVHAGLDQVHQAARAEVKQQKPIGLHQITGGGPGRVHIGAGSEDSHAHDNHTGLW